MKSLSRLLLMTLVFAGCYSPSIPSGKQECGPGGLCASGYFCGPDGLCYKNGQAPKGGDMGVSVGDMGTCTAMSCKGGPKPFCDSGSGACVECITDANCPSGKLCTNKACVPGCNGMHGCPDGGGICTNNQCMVCTKDADCGGGTPRCDTNSGSCAECLPTNDNCPMGKFCGQVNMVYTCQTGCQTVADCPKPDGGGAEACCNHVCVDTDLDGKNCGMCGNDCGNESCCGGKCSNVAMDLNNCGLCGNACAGKNATWSCAAGMCGVTGCSQGFGDCNGSAADGCEASLVGDPSNCSKCGMKCSAQNATPSCTMGVCGIGMCMAGFGDCNKNPADGCETNLNGDTGNCGMCGMICKFANASPACVAGSCVIAMCTNGFSDCDNNQANGCESNTSMDVNNCGGCNNKCGAPANATVACQASKCVLTSCLNGWKDCNMMEGDGCETTTTNDVNNCGGCGTKCTPGANVTGVTCAASACKVTSCAAGFADCNGIFADGCEVNLNTDANNCSKCGMKCGGNVPCVAGACGAVCDPATAVAFNGHCYYLDGSGGVCDPGYALASQSVLTNIAPMFIGKTYRHTVSNFCCIWNSDPNENWGFPFPGQCNSPGPFTQAPLLGGANCNNIMIFQAGGLTLCGN
jgi:hypothetical protein